jgi:thiol-disulfide isomerase/thioredoxin
MMSAMAPLRVRAPELIGRSWLNTGGRRLQLEDFRGRVVILDFWTSGCVNCLHVLDELSELEDKWRDALAVVGVHSPKFPHEADHAAVVAAVERYDVRHPVLDDPELATWRRYTVRAWPTFVVIDPEGYIVGQLSGEGHGPGLEALIEKLVAVHSAKGTFRRGDEPLARAAEDGQTALRFPGKAARLADGTILVSDTRRQSLAVLTADLETVARRIGGGEFAEPQGVLLLPPAVAAEVGYDVIVADTGDHVLSGVRLETGDVRRIAGTGKPWRPGAPSAGPATEVDLSSPWDVAWFDNRVAIAMAGIHQLWAFDPRTATVEVLAGTAAEGLRDGPAAEAWLAQPSGLAVSRDGRTLWFADAETSALRWFRDGEVATAVGQGLFDFGHRDGPAAQALLQHPLGLTVLPDESVAVLDTYNSAVRCYDPSTGQVSTLATGLREPSDAVVVGVLLAVVESAAHRVTWLPLPAVALRVQGAAQQVTRPPTVLAPGKLALTVEFAPASGQHLDGSGGPPTRLTISAAPPELLVEGAGTGSELSRDLVLSGEVASGVLHVAATAATCAESGEHPACYVHQQDWGVPVRLAPAGATSLELPLRKVSEMKQVVIKF